MKQYATATPPTQRPLAMLQSVWQRDAAETEKFY